MKIVSDNIKNALKQPTTQRKGRILVNGNYYEVYNVEYFADAYEDGNVIGNAIASQLDFDLPYMDKFNTFKYFDGVWTGNEYEYVDMGTFTVFDEQDEDEFNKHITAFDNLIKFNKPFEETGTYPKNLYEELQNICQQAGVELVNATIPNGNFQIENNQFVNGETLKTVLKAICQISGNYGIIKEDKLVLQLTNDTDETIIKNQHEPVIWKRKTYGINQVILQLGDVEGEYVIRQDEEDIAKNGVHKLVITNNPFAYTQDKRDALIDELFNQVRGFGYIPYEMNYEWLNYLEIGDKITIDGIETLVLRTQGKSPTGLESFISAPAIIDSAVEYVDNTNSIKNQISRTEIIVDKQNQEIELIASKTEETTKTLKTEKSVESNGEEIYIEDSGGYDLEKLRIDGKSVQNGTPTPTTPVEIESLGTYNETTGKYEIEVKVSNGTDTKITVLELNEPLRSLPNRTKDIAYIKNNKLYVDRYIKSITLNGSENWIKNTLSSGRSRFVLFVDDGKPTQLVMCDHFKGAMSTEYNYIFMGNSGEICLQYELSTANEFKTWLSNNNVQVDYELATPITEEIGFVSIHTFENINHINLYGKISTSFGITYLTDSYLNEQFATKSEIKITNDEINILSKKIQPVSNAVKGTGEIKLENAYEGLLHKLSIKGSISLIYPNNNLFPSSNLTPKSFKLQVDGTLYDLDINYLNYINENICDEFVYENGNCYIVRRVGINENGEMYELTNELIEQRENVLINVLENSTITLLGFDNAILTAEYLLQNQYTDVFATEAYVNSEIKQTADEINIEVAKKVNEDEVVNTINVSTEQITLKGNRLVVEADNFELDSEGNMICKNASFVNGSINTNKDLIVGDNAYIGQNQLSEYSGAKYLYFSDNAYIRRMLYESGSYMNMHSTFNTRLDCNNSTNINVMQDRIQMSHTPAITSDIRKKQNIKEIDVSWINNLKVKEFEYIKTPKQKQIGLIAQDYIENDFSKYFLQKDDEGYYSINYGNITNALIKYCQNLEKEIQRLKEMIK